jgi:hypothetical protein
MSGAPLKFKSADNTPAVIPMRKLTDSEIIKVLELLVARATIENQETSRQAHDGSADPIHKALTGKVAAHASGRLAGLTRALLLIKGGWQVDDVVSEAVHDIVGDLFKGPK